MDKRSKNNGRKSDAHRVYAPTHGDARRSSGMDLSDYHTAQSRSSRIYAPTHGKKTTDEETDVLEREELELPPNTKSAGQKEKSSPEKRRKKKDPRGKKQNKGGEIPLQRILTLAIIGVVVVGSIVTAYFLLKLDRVIVNGSERFSAEEIVEFSGIQLGKQLWRVNLKKAEQGIEDASPYLEVEKIERVYPDTLRITIRERQEAAAIAYQNMTVIIDSEGYVLSIGYRGDLTGLLLVKGMSASGYTVNQRLRELTDFYTNTLIKTMAALEEHNILSEIAVLDVSNPLSILMETNSGVSVHIGQAERLDEKMEDLSQILPELERLGLTEGTLDLSAKGDPVYSPPETATPVPVQDEPANTQQPEDTQLPETTDPLAGTTKDPEADDLPSG